MAKKATVKRARGSVRSPGGDGGRRARILEAARTLFAERGFDGVSVRDVSQRAGVNKGLVFYYFGSKDDLFSEVLAPYYEAQAGRFREAFGEAGTLRERIHRFVDAYLDFMEGHHLYARIVQQEVARGSTALPRIQRGLTDLYEWTRDALGPFLPERGPLAPRHFFVTFSGLALNYLTYADALSGAWTKPLSPRALSERRRHVHWVVETLVDGLEREAATPTSGSAPDVDA